jgi:ABC-type multidrug transport system ATPase subunit
LLGPPGSGKSTLLKALSGKLEKNLAVKGNISLNGHTMDEFVIQRTCAYIEQVRSPTLRCAVSASYTIRVANS